MKEIPEIRGLPVFGNYFVYQRDRLKFLRGLLKKCGDLAAFRMGSRSIILATRSDDVAWVLQKNAKNYVKATNLGEILGQGVLTSEGELWRRQRKLIQPVFHHEHLGTLVDLMNEKAREVITRFSVSARTDEAVEISSAMTELACEVVGNALFGADLNPHFSDLSMVLKEVERSLTRRLYRLLPIPLSVPLPSHRSYLHAIRTLDRIIYSLIDGKSRPTASKNDLVSILIHAKDEESGESMSREQVRDEAATLLLAGHETTAQTLAWTIALVSRYPKVEAEIVNEIRTVLGERDPGLEDLGRLPLLSSVISESMRIHPTVWAFGRRTLEEDSVRGFRIPAGSIVLLSPYFSHRNPEVWPEPEEFRPSRFESGKTEEANRFGYFPFGAGPRQCIGKHFALMELKIVLAHFYRSFHAVRLSSEIETAHPQVTMGIRGGLRMKLERRGTNP